MSEPLKIGDRVRVVNGEICKPSSEKAARILSGEIVGVIAGCNKKWSFVEFDGQTYPVPSENLKLANPRRTFEEICKELAEKPEFKEEWEADFEWAERTVLMTNERGIMLHFYDDGDVRFETDFMKGYSSDIFTSSQLAAIAAACQEIAANDQADHGKENQQ